LLVWVKAGSVSERPGEYGLAHLMEHMLFKGTHQRGPGEIAREVEAAGGDINAYTSYDETVYYIDMASRYVDRGLNILATWFYNPSLDPQEFAGKRKWCAG
jgi:zinc protease